jgi:hypothetical protein
LTPETVFLKTFLKWSYITETDTGYFTPQANVFARLLLYFEMAYLKSFLIEKLQRKSKGR